MHRRHRRRTRLPLLGLALAGLGVIVWLLVRGGGGPAPPALLPAAPPPKTDPLAWTPERSAEYERRAAAGLAHVLYAKTPGGIVAGAARTERFRPDIERVAAQDGLDADALEGLVLLESAGRPEAQASDDLAGAVGLTQILAETGRNLLGMHVDLAAGRRLTRQIARAARRGRDGRVRELMTQRRRADQRFDPQASIAAAGRYLKIARDHLGRDDLALAAYHMGIGNLQTALSRYGAAQVPYAQLFFDSTPLRHPEAHAFLATLGDDSSTYLWRVRAAEEILRLYRDDPKALAAQAQLQTARNSAEVALHPPGSTEAFADADALQDARDDGTIVPLPRAYLLAHGLTIDRGMGELADQPQLYRGLRRTALATLAYIGSTVRSIAGAGTTLRVTSTVRDAGYQHRLAAVDGEATHGYSLHTTGYAFDIARDYSSRRQAVAFQYVLDRLTALNLIAWVREPGAIHVTAASDAARLERPMGVRPGP